RRLEKSKISVETAHHRMLELDRSFREAVSLSHLALNQLLEMDNDSDAHLQNLKQSDKQLHELQKFSSRLATLLLDHEKLVDATYADAKQLTLHSDRLSRILTRQFFEVSHCDRLVEGTHVSLDRLNLKLEEGINQADKLRTGLNHNFQKNGDTQSGGEQPSAQIARVAELIKSCHTSLEIICSPAELARSQLKGIYEEIALESQQNGRDPSPSQQALELEPIGAILLNSDVIPISNLETEQKVS
ncbi:MAG: hypothetical protein NTX25_00865, partial [Proteobacteria bacterium]|nr:hypothetical protein [Pseudomonadota bacterium]